MATCKITEYYALGQLATAAAQIPFEPGVAHQSVTYTTATQSSAFNAVTRFVKLYPSADCYVLFGTNPTATASHEFLKGTTDHWRAVPEGQSYKVSVYDGTS